MRDHLKASLFVKSQLRSYLQSYPCPSNIKLPMDFLIGIPFVVQNVTSLLLAFEYTGKMLHAFARVQHSIIKVKPLTGDFDFSYVTGASCIFPCVLLHILRAVNFICHTYSSLLWITGVSICFFHFT